MLIKNYLALLLVAFLLVLTSCGPVECIDADNWGNQYQMTIQSKGNGNPHDIYVYARDINGKEKPRKSGLQYTDWDSKYQLAGNGKDVIMVVNNSVTNSQQTVDNIHCGIFDYTNSWDPVCVLGDPVLCGNRANTVPRTDTLFSPSLDIATFPFCPAPQPLDINSTTVPLKGLPARFYMGIGLYATVCANGAAPSPESIACEGEDSVNVHVGDNACSDPGCISGSPFYQYNCPVGWARFTPPRNAGNAPIYLKILDRYYSDNNGAYTVTFKQGVKDDTPHAISTAASIVMSKLCNASKDVYSKVVASNEFIGYIRALLILYIVLLGIGFIFGITEMNAKELLISVFKIAVIQQLISADSWDFFSRTLFSFFQNGVSELVSLMSPDGSTSIASKDGGCIPNMAAFDQIDAAIIKLFSHETTAKIISVFWVNFWGFLFVIVLYVAIFFILVSIAKAIMVFIASYVAICLLIILAPLFIPFMLFKSTASLFQSWLNQLISYFIQPLVVLAFVFFMLQLVNNEMERMLGYRVCWKPWFSILGKDVYAWQPDYDGSQACIFTPNAILDKYGNTKEASAVTNICTPAGSNSGGSGKCEPYNCGQKRYLGYPYLNTDKDVDNRDTDRIYQLQIHEIVSFLDVLLFILMIYFIRKFGETVPELAKHLAGAGTSQVGLHSVAGGFLGATVGGAYSLAKKGGYKVLDKAYYAVTTKFPKLGAGRDLGGDYRRARAVVGEMGSMVKDVGLWAPRKIYYGLNKAPMLPIYPVKKIAPIVAKLPLLPAKLLGKTTGVIVDKVVGVDVTETAKKGATEVARAVLKAPVQAVLHQDLEAFQEAGKSIKDAVGTRVEAKGIKEQIKGKLKEVGKGIKDTVTLKSFRKSTEQARKARGERVAALIDTIKGFAGASSSPEAQLDEAAPTTKVELKAPPAAPPAAPAAGGEPQRKDDEGHHG